MKTFAMSVVIAVCLFMTASISAEVISWEACPSSGPAAPINCTVHEVRVNPCREADSGEPCRVKRGRKASISFDYTPNFSGETLSSRAYWATGSADIALPGMDENACNYTTCPATSSSRQSYNYDLKISKTYPTRNYDVKWKLWHTEGTDCCFVFKIKIYK